MGVGDQRHAPAALPPEKTRYPLYRRLGGPQGRPGRVRKIAPPPGFDPRTVQPVVSRYTRPTLLASRQTELGIPDSRKLHNRKLYSFLSVLFITIREDETFSARNTYG